MCAGRRRDNGAPRTRETAAYTYDLCAMIIGAAANVTGRHEALAPLLEQSNAAFERALDKYHILENFFQAEKPQDMLPPVEIDSTPTHFVRPPKGSDALWTPVRLVGTVDKYSGTAVVRHANGSLSTVSLPELALRKSDGNRASCNTQGCNEYAIHMNETTCECTACCTLVNPATQDFLFDPPTHDRVTKCHWAGILENNPKLVDDCAGNAAMERQLIDYCKDPKTFASPRSTSRAEVAPEVLGPHQERHRQA